MKEASGSAKIGAEARILATAAVQFALHGYHGVSTRDIASAAGVNEVTIYRHYPRKRDLYLAVMDAELGKVSLRGDLLARLAEASDGRTVLTCTFELIARTLLLNPELLRLLQYGALEVSEDLDPLLRRHLGELVKVISRYLVPWVDKGELRCTNAEALVLTLIAIVMSHQRFIVSFRAGCPVRRTCLKLTRNSALVDSPEASQRLPDMSMLHMWCGPL